MIARVVSSTLFAPAAIALACLAIDSPTIFLAALLAVTALESAAARDRWLAVTDDPQAGACAARWQRWTGAELVATACFLGAWAGST